ncbi:hypothetical protein VaNZ11_008443 [Volvox africanus]|uniref:Pherophorin domain-containing protein n=1 Tax=Volvox africanus TaxID=51714 RepID=A0ABQ5S557_9CHLO|nr:hypothetical protein VaNZ11_008443 [Volvox africanus]
MFAWAMRSATAIIQLLVVSFCVCFAAALQRPPTPTHPVRESFSADYEAQSSSSAVSIPQPGMPVSRPTISPLLHMGPSTPPFGPLSPSSPSPKPPKPSFAGSPKSPRSPLPAGPSLPFPHPLFLPFLPEMRLPTPPSASTPVPASPPLSPVAPSPPPPPLPSAWNRWPPRPPRPTLPVLSAFPSRPGQPFPPSPRPPRPSPRPPLPRPSPPSPLLPPSPPHPPRPPPPDPPEDLLILEPPLPCAWVTLYGTDFRSRRFLFPPTPDPVASALPDLVYTVEVTGVMPVSAVAVCPSAQPCFRPDLADGNPTEALYLQPSTGSLSGSGAAYYSRSQRLELRGRDFLQGVFVRARTDGSHRNYTIEVCARLPQAAPCSNFFGIMSVMRTSDAFSSEAVLSPNRISPPPWSQRLAQLAAVAADSPAAILTSTCVPPPGISNLRKVVFSWGWDFGGLPPSLASSGFVAVYRRYPLTTMSPGSYAVKFMKPENVSLAVIVRVKDGNPDVAGTLAEVREVVAASEATFLTIPQGSVIDITFLFLIPPLQLLNNIPQMSAAIDMTWRPSPPSPPPAPPLPPSPPPSPSPPSPPSPSPPPPKPPSPPPRPPRPPRPPSPPPTPPPSPPFPPSPPLPSPPNPPPAHTNLQSADQSGSSASLRRLRRSYGVVPTATLLGFLFVFVLLL